MARIVLIHGFNVRDAGAGTIDQLAPYLDRLGHSTDEDSCDYGWHWLIKVRMGILHQSAIERIAGALLYADVLITHSNGRNYGEKAIGLAAEQLPDKAWHFISIAGARENDAPIHPNVSRMDVIYSKHDKAVAISRFLPGHRWGNEGQVGYQGDDRRVRNHDYTYRLCGHSAAFKGQNADFFARLCHQFILEQQAGSQRP